MVRRSYLRAGSALNLNIHFHTLLLDGVCTAVSPFAPAVFRPTPDFDNEDIARVLHTIRTRILRLLQRRGIWPAPGEEDFDRLTFIERLAALVPRPGVHQVAYHWSLQNGPRRSWTLRRRQSGH